MSAPAAPDPYPPASSPPAPRRGLSRWWLMLLAVPVVLALALLVFMLSVDPSRFRGAIETQVLRQSGLQLQLQGRLHWRLWPLLAIESEGGTLQEPLLSWQHLVFSAPLIDLLRGRWNLKSLQVEGLQLKLRRDANGHGNWQLAGGGGPASPLTLRLDELVLKDAVISYEDERAGSRWNAGPLAVQLDLALDRQPPDTRLVVRGFSLALADSTVRGSIHGVIAGDSAQSALQGQLELNTGSLRGLLTSVGAAVPATRDSTALGPLRMHADWSLAQRRVQAAAVQLQLDATQLTGTLAADLAPDVPQVTVNLKGNMVDFDRYMPPGAVPMQPQPQPPPQQAPLPPQAPPPQLAPSPAPASALSASLNAALAMLKSLPVTGVLELDSAHGNGVTLKGVRLKLEDAQ